MKSHKLNLRIILAKDSLLYFPLIRINGSRKSRIETWVSFSVYTGELWIDVRPPNSTGVCCTASKDMKDSQ